MILVCGIIIPRCTVVMRCVILGDIRPAVTFADAGCRYRGGGSGISARMVVCCVLWADRLKGPCRFVMRKRDGVVKAVARCSTVQGCKKARPSRA